MLVNVNMTSKFGKKEAKTFHFVSAIPVTQSSSITSTASSSTLGQSRTEDEIESTTMNVNVTLNVTAEGKWWECFLFSIFIGIKCKFMFFIDASAIAEIDTDFPNDITKLAFVRWIYISTNGN